MATRCCSPPESWCGILWALVCRPTIPSTSITLATISFLFFQPVASSTKRRLSSTLRSIRSWKSWNTTPILRRRNGILPLLIFHRLNPATSAEPFLNGSSAMRVFIMELFPLPTFPRRYTNSPLFMVMFTFERIRVSPFIISTSCICTRGCPASCRISCPVLFGIILYVFLTALPPIHKFTFFFASIP